MTVVRMAEDGSFQERDSTFEFAGAQHDISSLASFERLLLSIFSDTSLTKPIGFTPETADGVKRLIGMLLPDLDPGSIEKFCIENSSAYDPARSLTDSEREQCDVSFLLGSVVMGIRELEQQRATLDQAGFRVLVDKFADAAIRLGIAYQKMLLGKAENAAKTGVKVMDNLRAARESKEGPKLSDVERVLDELRLANPRLSETRRRELAAKELQCSLRTILRRLDEKSSDD